MTTTAVPTTALPADWRDFLALTKPRVMTLVVFTGLCGMLAAPVAIHPVLGFTAILCIALGAGAAGALNQWYEADIDAHDEAHPATAAAGRADGAAVGAAFRGRARRLFGDPDGAGGRTGSPPRSWPPRSCSTCSSIPSG